MTEEWRQQLVGWASEWLEPGEEVRAVVTCYEWYPPSPVKAAPDVLTAATPNVSAGRSSKGEIKDYALMATSKRVVAFPLRDDGLDPPRYSAPLGELTVKVKRRLMGSYIYLGRRQFHLRPRTRKDALEVAACAS